MKDDKNQSTKKKALISCQFCLMLLTIESPAKKIESSHRLHP